MINRLGNRNYHLFKGRLRQGLRVMDITGFFKKRKETGKTTIISMKLSKQP